MDEFAAVFEGLADPRTGTAKRHGLPEILLIAPGTLLSGAAPPAPTWRRSAAPGGTSSGSS